MGDKSGSEPEVKSDTTRSVIVRELKDQYKMPWEQQRALIVSETPLTQFGTQLAVRTARSFGLPLQGVNIIVTKRGEPKVYVNSYGVNWLLQLDPRGLKSMRHEIIHRPSQQEPWVEAKAVIEFNNGATFENMGVVETLPGPGVGNASMKSVTKAYRRAGVLAAGVPLPMAEEFYDYADEQRQIGKSVDTIDGEYREAQQKPIVEPKNLSELLVWVDQVGHTTDEAVQIAGEYATMAQSILATVEKLKGAWGI